MYCSVQVRWFIQMQVCFSLTCRLDLYLNLLHHTWQCSTIGYKYWWSIHILPFLHAASIFRKAVKLRPTNSSLAGGSQCWTASRATSYMSCLLGFSKDGSYSYRTWSDNECINIYTVYIWLYTYYLVYHKVSLKVATQCGSSCLSICMDLWFVWSHLQGQDPKFPKQDTRPGHSAETESNSCPVVKVCPGCCEGISWVVDGICVWCFYRMLCSKYLKMGSNLSWAIMFHLGVVLVWGMHHSSNLKLQKYMKGS